MRGRFDWSILGVATILAAGLAFAGCARNAPPAESPTTQVPGPQPEPALAESGRPGAEAYAFTGTTRAGEPFRLDRYRGRTVLVNFFSPG